MAGRQKYVSIYSIILPHLYTIISSLVDKNRVTHQRFPSAPSPFVPVAIYHGSHQYTWSHGTRLHVSVLMGSSLSLGIGGTRNSPAFLYLLVVRSSLSTRYLSFHVASYLGNVHAHIHTRARISTPFYRLWERSPSLSFQRNEKAYSQQVHDMQN